jgi:hypothetical protein
MMFIYIIIYYIYYICNIYAMLFISIILIYVKFTFARNITMIYIFQIFNPIYLHLQSS